MAERAFSALPNVPKFQDFRRMFDKLAAQIDAVTISAPDHIHAPAAVLAMKLGKHVFCEKPLAHSVYECRVMAETAAAKGVVTQMGIQGHSMACDRQIAAMVRAGVIGPVRRAHSWCPHSESGGKRPAETPPVPKTLDWDAWLGPAPFRPYHPAYVPFKWRGWNDFGTGTLGDFGCHTTDVIFTALDLIAPVRVEATGEPADPGEGFPTSLTVKYDFPARGAFPPLVLYWHHGGHHPGRKPLQDLDLPKDLKMPGAGAMFVGEKGILIRRHHGPIEALLPKDAFAGVKPPADVQGVDHLGEWLQACRTGGKPGANFQYAGSLTETILLGHVAHRAGKPIEWDSKNFKITNSPEAERLLRRAYREGWAL
jgi:predicted dehydrogenase